MKIKRSNSPVERTPGHSPRIYNQTCCEDTWSPLPSDQRSDRKLFQASTTTLCDTKLHRTSSHHYGSMGSSRYSQSSLNSQHDAMGSGIINSLNSNSINASYSSSPMERISFSEWEYEGSTHGFLSSATNRASGSSESPDLIRFSDPTSPRNPPHEVTPRLRNEKSNNTQKTAFSETAMMHASCPTLNVARNPHSLAQRTFEEKSGQSAVSSMNIGRY